MKQLGNIFCSNRDSNPHLYRLCFQIIVVLGLGFKSGLQNFWNFFFFPNRDSNPQLFGLLIFFRKKFELVPKYNWFLTWKLKLTIFFLNELFWTWNWVLPQCVLLYKWCSNELVLFPSQGLKGGLEKWTTFSVVIGQRRKMRVSPLKCEMDLLLMRIQSRAFGDSMHFSTLHF